MLNFQEAEEPLNIMNALAAGVTSRVYQLRKEVIKDSMLDFDNEEHRLESVATVHGIEFINDSKATNMNSTWYAIDIMFKPVIWIAGGQDKRVDYASLKETVGLKVKAIVCIGSDNCRLIKNFKKLVPEIVEAASLEDAVKKAYYLGKSGDAVLLSPACASFDAHKNFAERGWRFKNAVREL